MVVEQLPLVGHQAYDQKTWEAFVNVQVASLTLVAAVEVKIQEVMVDCHPVVVEAKVKINYENH